MSNLYQDAILDAKALRASAMANAKAALEEAFEPKIQEMMRIKLSEEFDSLEEDDTISDIETDAANDGMEEESLSPVGMEENMDINEAELEEILAQLEELSKDEEPIAGHKNAALQASQEDTAYKELQEAEEAEEDKEEEESEEEGEEESEESDEMIGDETKIIDITLGDLKQVLQSVMAGQEGIDLGMDQDVSDAEAADAEAESEISLDEILAELEMEEEGAEKLGKYKAELTKEPDTQSASQGFGGKDIFEKKAKEEDEKELEEARATIDVLRQNLQEVNLLNAKYLYMNKLFKSKSLTESQKVKVINALDRASNVAEVKNTYETLKESFSETKKTQLKESIGFASQAAGMAPKGNIVDADPFINRWQKLAGIPKRK
jgi:hypothetical protein